MRIKIGAEVRQNGPPPRPGLKAASPGAADEDCNSNTSLTGSQHDAAADFDAPCDNSDYLWFLDYNPLFRSGSCHHASVLSVSSYKGVGEPGRFAFTSRYDDLARDLDANLAEADMESFRTEDIHALLMTANVPRDAIVQHDETTHDSLIRGETIASITSSIMEKFRFDCSMSLDSVSQGDESAAGSINTMSLCKSELLFSPVKEPSHGVHFSVDSLDCELPSERELILTCRANKDNYTIAFEGSLTAYEDEGHCDAHAVNNRVDIKKEVQLENEANDERTRRNLELLDKCHKLTDNLTLSMARSDLGFTTWSKLKKQTCQSPLKRHGSGNNNQNSREPSESSSEVSGSVIKSQSLPNLCRSQRFASCSLHSAALSNSTIDSFTHTSHQRQSGAGTCMKVYDVAHNASCVARSHCSQHSEPMSTSSTENQSSTDKSQPKPSFNLVKLFMKQKSMSNEGIVSLDQLERSECWPSSSGGESDSFGAESKTKHIRIMEKLPKEDNAGNDEIDFTNTTEYTPGIYEPNILNTTQILTCNRVYDEALIEEEENGESANVNNRSINDSETNLYATVNKPQVRRNVNHMNLTNSPLRIRNVQSKRSCSSQSSATSVSISSCSDSDGTQLTRMHRLVQKDHSENRAMSTQVQVDTVDRSMQTSSIGVSYVASERDLIKIVEPSFLEKLKEGDCQKPVFVLYPNYALPDISFLNGRPNIYLNPQRIAISPDKKNGNPVTKGKRPFSCNDLELLRKKGFSHIRDWDSLKFLLPNDCKQLLSEVPEIMKKVQNSPNSKEKFCTSSPAYGKSKCRPMSCDCNNLTGNHVTNVSSSSSTATQPSSGYRGSSTMLTDSSAQNSPAPSNFNPLFVYRYDSATSSEASYVDKANPTIPRRSLSLAEQQKVCKTTEPVPPRPPLPKGILRKSMDKIRKTGSSKRYSMFEMDDFLQDPIPCMTAVTEQKTVKRRSLQEPYYLQKQSSVDRRKNNDIAAKRLSQQFLDAADKDAEYNEYYHDEGVGTESSLDSGKSNEVKYHRPQTPPMPKPRTKKLEYTEFPPPGALISSSELQQLEEFLELSGFSCENMDEWDQNQVQKVRKQVSKFFHMKLSQEDNEKSTDSSGSSKKSVSFVGKGELKKAELKPVSEVKEGTTTPPNSPNISVLTQRQYQQMNARRACRSAGKNLAEMPICEEGETSPEEYGSPRRDLNSTRAGSIDISQKRALVASVADAVEMMIQHFAPATDQVELAALGDSDLSPACAKIALNALCPALYAIFRDGLRENIETSFGAVNNSVWQMVEATARQGPITRSLNELVLKINSEDAVTEGLVKFNSFILGLLNAQSVDSWVSYMRTRESDLRKHYTAESLLRAGCAGAAEPGCRALLDALLASLRPLRLLPFRLQLMFEMRELHRSFKRIESEMRAASRPTTLNPPSLTLNQRNLLKLVRSLQSSFASSDRDDGSQNSVIMRHKEQTVVKNKEPSTPDLLNDSAKVRTLCGERSRPRSCVNPTMNAHDDCPNNSRIEVDQTRRWSGVQLGSKLMQAFDRLVLYDDSDDYTDSLENNKAGPRVPSNNTKLDWSGDEAEACSGGSRPPSGASAAQTNGGKFRKLQLKWELLSNGDSSPNTPPGTSDTSPASSRGSRIPRPVTSPVRPPAPLTSPAKQPVPAQRGIPVALRKGSSPTTPSPRAPLTTTPVKRQSLPSRASRVEQATGATPRPSSLPYGRTTAAAAAGKRRAASSSLSRNDRSPTANSAAAAVKKNKPRMVRTLWHRLPSDSGHLAFSEGERLRLVLEVDAQYLLCCRGDQKGLVPRDAVILESSLNKL